MLLAYPLLVHAAVLSGEPVFGFVAIVALILLTVLPALLSAKLWPWPVLAFTCAAAWPLAQLGDGMLMLYLPPVLIPLMLMVFFGRTLRPGSVPLITRIAAQMRGDDMPAAVRRYTRKVTWMWTIVFALMALEATLLAALVSHETWSLVTNAVNWILLAVLMSGEYLYHSRVYPNRVHNNFLDFLRDMARIDLRRLLSD